MLKERLVKVIRKTFEDFREDMFREDMLLDDIPGWDSMNSVNFQLELETEFNVKISNDALASGVRISKLIGELQNAQGKP